MAVFDAGRDVSGELSADAASGLSSSGADAQSASNDEGAVGLAIEETGWSAKDSYVHYGVMVRNSNRSFVAEDARLSIVGKDEAGSVLFTDEVSLQRIGPSTVTGFAGKAGNGLEPASVEFELMQDDIAWTRDESYVEPFTIARFEEHDMLYFRYELNAAVTNHTETYASTVPVSAIMRGKDGSIVSGYAGAAYRVKPGRTKDFVLTMNSAPDHAAIDVYAHPAE